MRSKTVSVWIDIGEGTVEDIFNKYHEGINHGMVEIRKDAKLVDVDWGYAVTSDEIEFTRVGMRLKFQWEE